MSKENREKSENDKKKMKLNMIKSFFSFFRLLCFGFKKVWRKYLKERKYIKKNYLEIKNEEK